MPNKDIELWKVKNVPKFKVCALTPDGIVHKYPMCWDLKYNDNKLEFKTSCIIRVDRPHIKTSTVNLVSGEYNLVKINCSSFHTE